MMPDTAVVRLSCEQRAVFEARATATSPAGSAIGRATTIRRTSLSFTDGEKRDDAAGR
jgi:hypothetical protein